MSPNEKGYVNYSWHGKKKKDERFLMYIETFQSLLDF